MSDNKSMWELSSGLPLEGAEVTISDAIFTYDTSYQADAVVLRLTFTFDEEGIEDATQLYSCGKRWEPADDGDRVQHESGKTVQFNSQTNIGKLIKSYIMALGDGDEADGLRAAIDSGIEPNHVDTWKGLHIKMKGHEFTNQNGKTSTTFLIGELLEAEVKGKGKGKATVTKLADKQAGKATTSKAAAAAADDDDDDSDDPIADHLGAKLHRKLLKLAAGMTHDEFMEAAFEMDDVTSDDKAWNKTTERYIMSAKSDGLWATANAE